jgi:glycopeptide antibiotics resistance protein
MIVNFTYTHLLIGLAALMVMLVVLRKKNKSFSYLFFFSMFWIYMMGVAGVVAFPFFIGYSNADFKPRINLIPLNFGDCGFLILCIRNIYENILLTVPFGFGISFITSTRPKNIFWLAIAVGFTFEITQLVISLVFKSPFRSVDINDVILNAIGVLLGYGIFRIFARLYSYTINRFGIRHKYIFSYIYDVVQRTNKY